jgi:segregation and condensation protein A
LPEVLLGVDQTAFAELAAAVFRPKPPPMVSLDHLHMAKISVREHAAILRARLVECGRATFGELVVDCEHTMEVVARFLALLDLYRQRVVLFQQEDALTELHIRWVGGSLREAERAEATDLADRDDEDYR